MHQSFRCLAIFLNVQDLLDVYVANGNKHVSYWQLHDDLHWDSYLARTSSV